MLYQQVLKTISMCVKLFRVNVCAHKASDWSIMQCKKDEVWDISMIKSAGHENALHAECCKGIENPKV